MPSYFSIKPGCAFHPFHNGATATEYVVRTADRRQFKISEAAHKLLHDLDSGLSVEDLHARMVTEQRAVPCEDLSRFILTHYGAFLDSHSGQRFAQGPASSSSLGLLVSGTLLPGGMVERIARGCAFLYERAWAAGLVALIITAHWALYSAPLSSFRPPTHLIVVLSACIFSVIVHEFGHASAVARFGGKPGGIGAGLYILLPVFFADVSQIWTFTRRQRVIVDLGGVYFQQIAFAVLALGAVVRQDPSLRAACVGIDVMTAITINPIFRFDGYWVLSDWLGLSGLHRAALIYLKSLVVSAVKLRPMPLPVQTQLRESRIKMVSFVLYAVAGNFLFTAAVLMNLRWIQSTVTGLFRHVPALVSQAGTSLHAHQWFHAIDLLTGILFLCASSATLLGAVWFRGRQLSSAAFARVRLLRQKAVPHLASH